jgi:hypothetical protein
VRPGLHEGEETEENESLGETTTVLLQKERGLGGGKMCISSVDAAERSKTPVVWFVVTVSQCCCCCALVSYPKEETGFEM